jgi:hypothetical protein
VVKVKTEEDFCSLNGCKKDYMINSIYDLLPNCFILCPAFFLDIYPYPVSRGHSISGHVLKENMNLLP